MSDLRQLEDNLVRILESCHVLPDDIRNDLSEFLDELLFDIGGIDTKLAYRMRCSQCRRFSALIDSDTHLSSQLRSWDWTQQGDSWKCPECKENDS